MDASAGVAIGSGGCGQISAALFGEVGLSVGIAGSVDVFGGIFGGDVADLAGAKENISIVVKGYTLTVTFSADSGSFSGVTVGKGTGLPYGVTKSYTDKFISDPVDLTNPGDCGCPL